MAKVYGKVLAGDGGKISTVATTGDDVPEGVSEDAAAAMDDAYATLPEDTSAKRNKPAPAANAATKKSAAAGESTKQE